MKVFLLVYSINASLNEAPVVAQNCLANTFEFHHEFAQELTKQWTAMGAVCQKRDGIYEWICAAGDEMFTITIKKDEADCRATPQRTLNQLRTMMRKPTL